MKYTGIDKLFLINSWRHHNGLKEWPVPGCIDFPKPKALPYIEILRHNNRRSNSSSLRGLLPIFHIFKDFPLQEHRNHGFLMGYFRYEVSTSEDYKPASTKTNDFCLSRAIEKTYMFSIDKNITYIFDTMNLVELYCRGVYDNHPVDHGSYQDSIGIYDLYKKRDTISLLKDKSLPAMMYIFKILYRYYRWWVAGERGLFLKWDDNGRLERGVGA